MGDVVDAVKDVGKMGQGLIDMGKGVVQSVGNVGEGLVDIVQGESPSKAWGRLGDNVNSGIEGTFDFATFGQEDLINKYTGDTVTKLKHGYSVFGDALAGRSIDDNLKTQASLILQAGQAFVGQAGLNVGGFDMTGLANNVLGGLNNKLNEGSNSGVQTSQPTNITYANPNLATYNGAVAEKNYLPYILFGGVAIIGIVLIIKKKRK